MSFPVILSRISLVFWFTVFNSIRVFFLKTILLAVLNLIRTTSYLLFTSSWIVLIWDLFTSEIESILPFLSLVDESPFNVCPVSFSKCVVLFNKEVFLFNKIPVVDSAILNKE